MGERWRFAREIVGRPLFRIGAIVIALFGGLQIVRGELPQDSQKWLQLATYLPSWSWQVWVVIVLAFLLVVVFEHAFRAAQRRAAESEAKPSWIETNLEPVNRRTFTNEVVEIDGKRFEKCRFQNTTLMYRGKGGADFIECAFVDGQTRMATDFKPAAFFSQLMHKFKGLPSAASFQYGEQGPDGEFVPIGPVEVRVLERGDDAETDDHMEIVSEADFVNQSIQIDGRFFQHCRFQNATLVYDGRRGTGFLAPKFEGSLKIQSNNQAAIKYARFLSDIRRMPGVDSIQLHDHPEGGKFTPVGPIQLGPGTSISLDLRRVRLLEYHGMHLSWVRQIVSNPKSTDEQLGDLDRVIDEHRHMLQDLAPDMLPLSVVEEFREPATYKLNDAVKAYLADLTFAEKRADLFGKVDHLLRAILWAWFNHSGVQAPRP